MWCAREDRRWNSGTYSGLAEGQQVSVVNTGTKTLMVIITGKLIMEAHSDLFFGGCK